MEHLILITQGTIVAVPAAQDLEGEAQEQQSALTLHKALMQPEKDLNQQETHEQQEDAQGHEANLKQNQEGHTPNNPPQALTK